MAPAPTTPVFAILVGGAPCVERRGVQGWARAARTTGTAASPTRPAPAAATGQGPTATPPTAPVTPWTVTAKGGVRGCSTFPRAAWTVFSPWARPVTAPVSMATRPSPSPTSVSVTPVTPTLAVRQSALPVAPAPTPPVSVRKATRETTVNCSTVLVTQTAAGEVSAPTWSRSLCVCATPASKAMTAPSWSVLAPPTAVHMAGVCWGPTALCLAACVSMGLPVQPATGVSLALRAAPASSVPRATSAPTPPAACAASTGTPVHLVATFACVTTTRSKVTGPEPAVSSALWDGEHQHVPNVTQTLWGKSATYPASKNKGSCENRETTLTLPTDS